MLIQIPFPLSLEHGWWLHSHLLRDPVWAKVEGRQLLVDKNWLVSQAATGDETAGCLLRDYMAGQNSPLPPFYCAKRGRPSFANDFRDMTIFLDVVSLMTVKGRSLENACADLAGKVHFGKVCLSEDAIRRAYKRIWKAVKVNNSISVWWELDRFIERETATKDSAEATL